MIKKLTEMINKMGMKVNMNKEAINGFCEGVLLNYNNFISGGA